MVSEDDSLRVVQVVALDGDLGENGTVRYSAHARGPARGLLRVNARTGQLYASPKLVLAPHDSYDVTVLLNDNNNMFRDK